MSTHAQDLATFDEPEAPPAPRPPRRILRAAIVAVAAVAGAATYAVWFWPAGSTAPAGYVTVAVDRGPIEQAVNATGTVNPVSTVQVGTYVSGPIQAIRSEEHTSELQSHSDLVCRLLLEKKKHKNSHS